MLAQNGAFKHYFFTNGYRLLAHKDQSYFGGFMSDLYSINRFEFKSILEEGIFLDSPFKKRMLDLIREKEKSRESKRIIV